MNKYMRMAVDEALVAYDEGNVPVGAVVVFNNEVVASCHNTKNTTNIAVNHAEILCIIEACKRLNSWYLNECDIYVTLKPCDMCLNALAEARIKNVYYLLDSNYDVNMCKNRNNINFVRFFDEYGYFKLLNSFFSALRE